MGKEVRKETDWFGNEKEVIYEDGNKVGETTKESSFFGGDKFVTRDTSGHKVSETREESGLFGDRMVTRDTSGHKISETRHEEGFFGSKDVIYEDGKKIGELRDRDTLFGTKKVLNESYGHDVDLSRRSTRENQERNEISGYSGSSESSSSSGSGSSGEGIGFFGWALIIGGLVALCNYLGSGNQQKQYPATTQEYSNQQQSQGYGFGPVSWFKISNKHLNSVQKKNPITSNLESDVNKILSNSPQKYYRVINDDDRKWDKYCYESFVLPQRKNNKSYPYIVKGDFNGDGIFDIAAIVAKNGNNNGDYSYEHLAIILSGKNDSDIMFFENQWGDAIELFQERHVNSRWEQPALDLKGDAIHRRRYESASRLIYWDGSTFKEYQMSD